MSCCSSCRHYVSVQELAGNKGETQISTSISVRAHLLSDGPADTDRNTDMEDGFTDQPQEVVDASQNWESSTRGVSALEDIETVDTVSETQDQTAEDDGRQERCEDLRQDGSQTLERILVLLEACSTASLETPEMPDTSVKSL